MALPKKIRFRSKTKINSLFSSSKRRAYPLFTLLFKKNLNNDLHLAVLVTKKVDKKSTQRNNLKRKFYQSLQLLIKKNKFHPADIIFIARKQALTKTQKEIEAEILKVLEKEGIILCSKKFFLG